jgi:hypothetical protein
MKLGDITAKLTADINDFEAKMETAKKLVGQVEKDSKQMTKVMGLGWEDVTKGSKVFLGSITTLGVAVGAYATKATLTAARTETMGIAMEAVAKATGTSTKLLAEQEAILKKQGITTQESRNILTRFMQSQLDVADASKIARIAQDLAVVAGENSSEMTGRLTDAIATMNPELLRQAGIVVNQEELFDAYAETLGRTGDELTQTEKKQALVWKIMLEGEKVAGSYEMAMDTAGKKMGSLARHFEEVENRIGEKFLPIFGKVIDEVTRFLETMTPEKIDAIFSKLEEWGIVIIAVIGAGVTPALWAMLVPLLPILKAIAILAAVGAAAGLVLKAMGVDITDVSGFIQNDMIPAVIKAKDWFIEAWTTVKKYWDLYGQPVFDFIVEFIQVTLVPAWEYLKEKILESMAESGISMEDLMKVLKVVAFVVGGILVGSVLVLVGVLAGLMFTIATLIDWMTKLRNIATDRMNQMRENFEWHVNRIKEMFGGGFGNYIISSITYPFEVVARRIKQIFDGIKNSITSALDLAKRQSPSVLDRLRQGVNIAEKEFERLGDMRIAPVAELMSGGVTGASGGVNLSINMSGANISSPEVAQEYAEQIGDAIIGKLRTNRRSYG